MESNVCLFRFSTLLIISGLFLIVIGLSMSEDYITYSYIGPCFMMLGIIMFLYVSYEYTIKRTSVLEAINMA